MNEEIADKVVNGLAKTFDVGFDIGKVSSGVAQGYFDLKRFEMIIGYASGAFTLVLCLCVVTFIVMRFLKSVRRGCLAEREEKLRDIANEREVFVEKLDVDVKHAVRDEFNKLHKVLREETRATFDKMIQHNRDAWVRMMNEHNRPKRKKGADGDMEQI